MKTTITLCLFLLMAKLSPAQYTDQGIWNDFHKNNLGKIVFSEQKIIHNNPDPSLVKTNFNLAKPVKCRLYIAKSLANICLEAEKSGQYQKGNFDYSPDKLVRVKGVFKVDGVEQNDAIIDLPSGAAKQQEWTTWWYSLIDENNMAWGGFPEKTPQFTFGKLIRDLKPGKHTIELTFYLLSLYQDSNESIKIASGAFTLEFTENEKNTWLNKNMAVEVLESNPAQVEEPLADYVTFKNNCSERIDIEYTKNGSTYSNTFINSSSQMDIKMWTGDQLRTKSGTVLYTHTATGSSKTVYLCN